MKRNYRVLLAGILTASFLIGGSAFARLPGGGGAGGIPVPYLKASNRKVELADGEMYTLEGKVEFDSNDQPFFWVDLSKHPWLANHQRSAAPYYALSGSRADWRQYSDHNVELLCIAHGVVIDGEYHIVLSAVSQKGVRFLVDKH